MKPFLIIVSFLALVTLVRGEQSDPNNPKRGKRQGQGQAQAQSQQHIQAQPRLQRKNTLNTTGGGNQGVNTQGNLTTKQQRHLQKQSNNLPAVQNANKTNLKNTTINKNVNVTKNVNVNKTVFKGKHFTLANKPNPSIQNVKFNKNYKIPGSQNWKGQKYIVFQNYHPQWHNQGWWHQHHNHVVLVFGGWYYWDQGYYYPAWGYAPDAYYAYDGPIYVGAADNDPGQVVANVQEALQQQGFYHGEVDGILGEQTRAALADFQQAQGLELTAAIDEPTLEYLGLV